MRALGLGDDQTPTPQYMVCETETEPDGPPPSGSAPVSRIKETRAERKAVKAHARRERDETAVRVRELDRWRQRWEAKGGDPLARPPLISREHWGCARAVIHSPAAARAALQWLARHHGGAVAARVADAAFQGGRWDFTKLPARKFVALATFMFMQARLAPWARSRDGRLQLSLCMRGVGRGALCALLADPHAIEPMSTSALSSWSDRWSGYLVRGDECLVWDRVQVPAEVAERWEIGPSGYACNRYWLCSSRINKPALDMSHVLDQAAEHERGWSIAFPPAANEQAPDPTATAPP